MSKVARLVTIAAALLLGFLAYQKFFPSDEKKIRKLLHNVAKAVSFEKGEGNLARLAGVNQLSGYVSQDVTMIFNLPGGNVREIQGRDELIQLALTARSALASVKVEFLDISVSVDPSKETATAELTAKATIPSEKDFFVQELKLGLKKADQSWRINRAETVRVFRQ